MVTLVNGKEFVPIEGAQSLDGKYSSEVESLKCKSCNTSVKRHEAGSHTYS